MASPTSAYYLLLTSSLHLLYEDAPRQEDKLGSACWLQRSKDFHPPGNGACTTCSGQALAELADTEPSDCAKDGAAPVPSIVLSICAGAVPAQYASAQGVSTASQRAGSCRG